MESVYPTETSQANAGRGACGWRGCGVPRIPRTRTREHTTNNHYSPCNVTSTATSYPIGITLSTWTLPRESEKEMSDDNSLHRV